MMLDDVARVALAHHLDLTAVAAVPFPPGALAPGRTRSQGFSVAGCRIGERLFVVWVTAVIGTARITGGVG